MSVANAVVEGGLGDDVDTSMLWVVKNLSSATFSMGIAMVSAQKHLHADVVKIGWSYEDPSLRLEVLVTALRMLILVRL